MSFWTILVVLCFTGLLHVSKYVLQVNASKPFYALNKLHRGADGAALKRIWIFTVRTLVFSEPLLR